MIGYRQDGLGVLPALAPILIKAIPALASLAAHIIPNIGHGCGQSCIDATNIVNQAEPILVQNRDAVFSGQISKSQGLNNFDSVWNSVIQACRGIPGKAGENCIGDRQRGGKWDWFSYYRTPIENYVEMGIPEGVVEGNIVGNSFGISPIVLIGALLVVGGIVAVGGNR